MKEVRVLSTSQVRIFPVDAIPLTKLMIAKHRKIIESLFNFEKTEAITRAGNTGMSFLAGSCGPKPLLVEEVTIEERRIITRVQGTTKETTSVYEEIKKVLEQVNEDRSIKELLCTHETASSVVLSVPFERVFSQPFLNFLNKSATKHIGSPWAEHYLAPTGLRFRIQYKLTDDTLVKNHIALAPKELVIEPRSQSALEDQLYWITSPTDTDTHFKLIDDLEKSLKGESHSKS